MNVLALLLCMAVLGLKFRGVLKGQGLLSAAALAVFTVATLFTIPWVHLTVDSWLGGHNFANLIVRLLIFGTAALFAIGLARILDAPRVEGFVRSRRGILAGAVSLVLLAVVLFPMGATDYSSTGLVDFNDSHWFRVYSFLGHLYPSILAGMLLVPLWRYISSPSRAGFSRIAYGFISVGMVGLVVLSAVYLLSILGILQVVQTSLDAAAWLSPLGFVVGALALTVEGWYIRRRRNLHELVS
ncbi:hypothetical protein [Microbacterium sp. NPDC055665]